MFQFLKHRFRSPRKIFKWALRWVALPVRRGPLKGKRWHIVTRSRFFLGTYELAQTALFQKMVEEGQVVYDVGAHVGYYTVQASMLVGLNGHVVSFEPVPANLYFLRRHLRLNGCDNVTVMEACVADRSGVCRFSKLGTGSGHIAEEGELTTRTVSLDELIAAGSIPPADCMKIDVEGAEYSVLQGARSLIATAHPLIFLSLHGDEVRQQCFALLSEHGYQLRPIRDEPLAEASEVLATYNQ